MRQFGCALNASLPIAESAALSRDCSRSMHVMMSAWIWYSILAEAARFRALKVSSAEIAWEKRRKTANLSRFPALLAFFLFILYQKVEI
jgi:hypothetical protein